MTDQPQPTKKERREAARAERIAQEQASAEAAARKKRLGIFGGLLLAAVAVVAVAIAISSSGDDSPKAGEVNKAAEVEKLYAGIPQDGVTLGDPKAKATIIFFAEPKCPVCRNFDETELPGIVEKLVRTGKAKMVLRMRAFLGADSLPGIRALNGASLQDKMYQAVGVTYANQGEESEEWLTDERIRELLGGVKGLDVDKAIKAGEGTEVERLIAEAETLAGRYGSEGTPDLYVGKSENDADNVDPTEASVTDAVNEIAGK